ncbi:MAB_1171c family putative transporter [Kitasatospora azatica]|uniref:MAB_1171c family putative transporter n=1 Tax=Kitasatospora azatica TaxID=58347 RepID=UPI0006912594|nr:MAB_1171c family putative transporter [Kitasatospora azatica]
MIGTLECLAGTIALGGAGHRAWLWRGHQLRAGGFSLIAFAVTIGLAQAALSLAGSGVAPATGSALLLLGSELKLAAGGFLVLMAFVLGSPDRRGRRVQWQAAGSALVMLADAALYGVAGVTPVGATLTVAPGGRLALAAFLLLLTAHSAWCVGLFTLVVRRAARGLDPGPLRTGLRLVVAGGVCGLIWIASGLVPLVVGLRTGRQDCGEDWFSAPVAVLALTLGLGGASLTALESRLTGPVRQLRARRSYRRIGPLWSALHAVRPEIALEPPISGIGLWGNTEFALYRRVIEIRDGQLWLRAHLHPQVPQWAAAACGSETGERRRAATVEAAVLAAALEAAAVGHRYPRALAEGYVPPAVPADLDTETAWLVMVSEEFTGSRVVAEIRQRVRSELALPDRP